MNPPFGTPLNGVAVEYVWGALFAGVVPAFLFGLCWFFI
jgi:hypothetical protein